MKENELKRFKSREEVVNAIRVQDNAVLEYIETLTSEARLDLRLHLQAQGFTQFPRNLFYNYQTQSWV